MKRITLPAFLAAALVLWNCAISYAYAEAFVTGKEWVEKMSPAEKFMALIVPMNLFHRYGVEFRRKPIEYIPVIDDVLLNNPYIEDEDVTNIFASYVYVTEPESRNAFRLMARMFFERRSFLDGDLTYDSLYVRGD